MEERNLQARTGNRPLGAGGMRVAVLNLPVVAYIMRSTIAALGEASREKRDPKMLQNEADKLLKINKEWSKMKLKRS